jgi:H+-translocating NAD(P) transhydrogenase subunit beta
MNCLIANVLFGAFGKPPEGGTDASVKGNVRAITTDQAADLLAASMTVIVVPGYGMAVSQAQHAVKELADVLAERSIDVKYAVHPVAGRMPGHMNVLLAEAGVPYDQLYDMDHINDDFQRADVAIVIGANDVVNPAARNNKASPIYGMPILNADQAKSVLVLKRSMAPGFAGIENELFYMPNCMMVFGDARKTVTEFSAALKRQAKAA